MHIYKTKRNPNNGLILLDSLNSKKNYKLALIKDKEAWVKVVKPVVYQDGSKKNSIKIQPSNKNKMLLNKLSLKLQC